MRSRTFAIYLVGCVSTAALLLSLGDVHDSFALAAAGLVALVVLGVAYTIWRYGD